MKYIPLIFIGLVITAVIAGGIYFNQKKLGDIDDVSASKVLEKYNASEIKNEYALEGTVLTKTDIKNPELDKYKNEPKDEVRVTIGDSTGGIGAGTDFKPDIELKRWNEVSFKIKADNLLKDVATKDKTLTLTDKIKFDTPKMSFEMYEVAPTATDEGSYKYI